MTELLLADSCIFVMREATPFATATINDTSFVDGFGNRPQFALWCESVTFTLLQCPPKAKPNGKKRKGAAPTPQPLMNSKKAPHVQVFTEGESLTDDEVYLPRQGSMMQQMSHMMDLLLDLSD